MAEALLDEGYMSLCVPHTNENFYQYDRISGILVISRCHLRILDNITLPKILAQWS